MSNNKLDTFWGRFCFCARYDMYRPAIEQRIIEVWESLLYILFGVWVVISSIVFMIGAIFYVPCLPFVWLWIAWRNLPELKDLRLR